MPIFNPSYVSRVHEIRSKSTGCPNSIKTELLFTQYLFSELNTIDHSCIYLYQAILETQGNESFAAFCEYDHPNKIIIDFTTMWLDVQCHHTHETFNSNTTVFKCFVEKIGANEQTCTENLNWFLRAYPLLTYDMVNKLVEKANAQHCIQVMEYPKIIKDIANIRNVNMGSVVNVWTPFSIPSNISSIQDLKPLKDRVNSFILIGARHSFVYPVRFYINSLNLPNVKVRQRFKSGDFTYATNFDVEHKDYLNDIESHRFSICTPAIVEIPVCKYYESMIVGSIVVTPPFTYMEDYGLVDRETCIVFDPLGDIKAQFDQISNIDIKTLEQIQLNAFNYVLKNRSFQATTDNIKRLITPTLRLV